MEQSRKVDSANGREGMCSIAPSLGTTDELNQWFSTCESRLSGGSNGTFTGIPKDHHEMQMFTLLFITVIKFVIKLHHK